MVRKICKKLKKLAIARILGDAILHKKKISLKGAINLKKVK